jgi:hypothetical protein
MTFNPLITAQRAQQNPQLAAIAASNPAYLASLVSAASELIRVIAKRDFSVQNYVDYYDLGVYQGTPIRLRQFPIIEITRVATDVEPVLRVANTNTAANQRATVETTATGVKLITVASAVSTPTVLLYETYPTIGAMANAIIAIGNGWTATVEVGSILNYSLYPSADLCQTQGAMTAIEGPVPINAWIDSLPPASGQYYAAGWGVGMGGGGMPGSGWNYDKDAGLLYVAGPAGSQTCRVDYTAGFMLVPQPIQEATTQLAVWLLNSGNKDWTVQTWRLGQTGQTLANCKDFPAVVSRSVSPFIARDLGIDNN